MSCHDAKNAGYIYKNIFGHFLCSDRHAERPNSSKTLLHGSASGKEKSSSTQKKRSVTSDSKPPVNLTQMIFPLPSAPPLHLACDEVIADYIASQR